MGRLKKGEKGKGEKYEAYSFIDAGGSVSTRTMYAEFCDGP